MTSDIAISPAPGSQPLDALLRDGFRDAVVVVVGGAGGIGAQVVEQAKSLGARVVVASRSTPSGETTPAGVRHACVDLTDAASIRAFADWVGHELGRIDVLVNTAGVTRSVPLKAIELLDDETIDVVMASNAGGVLKLIRDLAPWLRAGREPCVVNVSSVAARTGVGSNIAYVGAKAAMDAMTVSLAKALAPDIRLVNVAPSALETDFVKGRSREFVDRTIAATPQGRLATTTEVANAILCAARLLTMTTGSTIFVDGGRHL
ncbi:MAG: SDR family oxidoreductase [Caulobacter sp.]|nr:SDR family oxidoreductase [Caulobacter sp.]